MEGGEIWGLLIAGVVEEALACIAALIVSTFPSVWGPGSLSLHRAFHPSWPYYCSAIQSRLQVAFSGCPQKQSLQEMGF